jgi:(1->4)-alpha-D-glucan 1-alpha-D-glucosylmutase
MPVRIPGCTYRIQFNKDFNFRDATALVDYLDALGVTDIYASPLLAARPGSSHGYDVIDHARLNPELGTEGDLDALAAAIAARGMGLLLDVVPNHMCIASPDNRWWNDVLENGRSSPFAPYFDVDWHPPKPELAEKILLPVLGGQYGRVLESQELTIGYEAGAFHVRYYDHRFPIGPRTILPLLLPMVADLRRNHPDDHPDVLEIESIVTATRHLPTRLHTDPEQVRERQREKEIVKRRLDALVTGSAAARDALERSLGAINGERGQPRSFDALEALLADQAYRLSYWGVAAEEINYRRFFDINDLAAIRVEEAQVLEAVHMRAFEMLRAGKASGLRIDHVDGLFDPSRYLGDLCQTTKTYIVVEKILTGEEELPSSWPVHGTTGYDFLNVVNRLFIEPAGQRAIDRRYQRLREGAGGFDDLLYRAKKLILRTAMSSELYVLARHLDRLSEQHRWSRDFTQSSLHLALGEVIACFPVYRTYVQPGTTEISPEDRQHAARAIRDAKRRNRSTSESIFDFIADLLLLRDPDGLSPPDVMARRDFVLRFQQLTGPVMAKGLEDTVFYRYFPLAALNEVGSRPNAPPVDAQRLHAWNLQRHTTWPHALSATATHDTKRGEDMRARLAVLSELPRDWSQAVSRWQRMNRRHKPLVDDVRVPDSNIEYLIYQTILGAWPMDGGAGPLPESVRESLAERLGAYLLKALREAKLHTSWINVNAPYERAVDQFLRRLLTPGTGDGFLADLQKMLGAVLMPGLYNSLAQVVLKATAPGVPDCYQGTELWDLALVDPDNRRPVDYARRRALLAELDALDAHAAQDPAAVPDFIARSLREPGDGALKMFVLRRALSFRRRHRALFDEGDYVALSVEGERSRHVVAYARRAGGETSIVVVGRFVSALGAATQRPLGEVWGDARILLPDTIPAARWRDVIGGETVEVAPRTSERSDATGWIRLNDLFTRLPLALLEPHSLG